MNFNQISDIMENNQSSSTDFVNDDTNDDQKNSLVTTYPWIQYFRQKCLSELMNSNMKSLMKLIKFYNRNRPRKTTRAPMTAVLFQQARDMLDNGSSIRQAAQAIGFSEGALRKRLRSEQLVRFSRIFSPEQEKAILELYIVLDLHFFGLTLRSLHFFIFQYAEKNNINHRFPMEKKLAGRDFTRDFMRRNNISN